jgi:hypothetical protein
MHSFTVRMQATELDQYTIYARINALMMCGSMRIVVLQSFIILHRARKPIEVIEVIINTRRMTNVDTDCSDWPKFIPYL